MKLKTLLCVAAALTGFTAINASAVTFTTWGNVGAPVTKSAFKVEPKGLFDDVFSFSISSPEKITFSAVANNNGTKYVLSNETVSLFKGVYNGAHSLVQSYSFGTTSVTHSFTELAGNYFYEVKGSALGTSGGVYTLVSKTAIAAVPEPSAWAMMVAGLGLIGFMSNRRRTYA